jgi:hypothetical protein
MLYMLGVFIMVALPVFAMAGAFILAMVAWTEVQKYARALKGFYRTSAVAARERVVISRTIS